VETDRPRLALDQRARVAGGERRERALDPVGRAAGDREHPPARLVTPPCAVLCDQPHPGHRPDHLLERVARAPADDHGLGARCARELLDQREHVGTGPRLARRLGDRDEGPVEIDQHAERGRAGDRSDRGARGRRAAPSARARQVTSIHVGAHRRPHPTTNRRHALPPSGDRAVDDASRRASV
jgi:hypothetical protein